LEKYLNSKKFDCVYLGNLLEKAAQFLASWQLLLLCLLRGAPRGGGVMLNRMLGRICSLARMQMIKCLKIIIKNLLIHYLMENLIKSVKSFKIGRVRKSEKIFL
jgi:hypothetical protein